MAESSHFGCSVTQLRPDPALNRTRRQRAPFEVRVSRLIKVPIAVPGAEDDQIISASEIEQTARAYGVEPRMFASAHNMMSEPQWKSVAAWIADWAASVAGSGDRAQAEARGSRPLR